MRISGNGEIIMSINDISHVCKIVECYDIHCTKCPLCSPMIGDRLIIRVMKR
jgi:hypothetical protein